MALPIPFPTDGHIQRFTRQGDARNLWIPSSFDYDVREDFFDGAALDVQYGAAVTNGASAARTFTAGNTNSYLELVTGTANAGYAGTPFSLGYTGTRGVLFECVFRTPSAVTTLKFEFGLTDALNDAGAINVKATPTYTASDCAIICYDTDDDTNIGCFSVKADTGTATQDLNVFPIVASTTYRVAVRVDGASVSYYMNGTFLAGHDNGITAATALTPWFFAQARAGSASRIVQIHKWRCIQPAY